MKLPSDHPANGPPKGVTLMILDPNVPLAHRRAMLAQIAMDDREEAGRVIQQILAAATSGKAKELYDKKLKKVQEQLDALNSGPMRLATYVGKALGGQRAQVRLEDGTNAFVFVPDPSLLEGLRCGDEVLIDATGKALLHRVSGPPGEGEEGTLLRRVGENHVEVSVRQGDKHLFLASDYLMEDLDSEQLKPGRSVIVCPRRLIAYSAVPAEDGLGHYMYLDSGALPDVVVARDIGNPPAYIAEVVHHVRMEMQSPGRRRKYRIRRSMMKLLTGVPGSGKTLSLYGLIRMVAETVADIVGIPVEDLPARVLRMSMDKVLSMWLGQSDKQLARFFDEALALHDEVFEGPDGRRWHLPVIAIGEEIEALSRSRGGDHDGVYDRIQTVALQRLDTTRPDYNDRIIVFIFTTNAPQLVDPAFMRRAGGTIEQFGRLTTQTAFEDVLDKHLRDLPLAGSNGCRPAVLQRQVVEDVSAWLFSPNSEDGEQLEISLANAEQLRKSRRDFLTGALIDRAVQQAAGEACRMEEMGCENPGLALEMLVRAFDDQIRGIVDQANEYNVHQYVDLPDAARVSRVRRVRRRQTLPLQAMRA